jgi:hypothetical protein
MRAFDLRVKPVARPWGSLWLTGWPRDSRFTVVTRAHLRSDAQYGNLHCSIPYRHANDVHDDSVRFRAGL